LYAAVVILPNGRSAQLLEELGDIRDSKQMTPKKRETAASVIKLEVVAWGIGVCESAEIDAIGMAKAGRLVFERALANLRSAPDYLLIDYFNLPLVKLPQTALVKGDARSLSIACASILAKTARDATMRELDRYFPYYHFAQNKGYGTSAHRQALVDHGTCPAHRQCFQLFRFQEELF
jgi:ribonuclease HII